MISLDDFDHILGKIEDASRAVRVRLPESKETLRHLDTALGRIWAERVEFLAVQSQQSGLENGCVRRVDR